MPHSTFLPSISPKEAFTLSLSHLWHIMVSGTLRGPLSTTGLVVHLGRAKNTGRALIFLHYFPILDKCAHNTLLLL